MLLTPPEELIRLEQLPPAKDKPELYPSTSDPEYCHRTLCWSSSTYRFFPGANTTSHPLPGDYNYYTGTGDLPTKDAVPVADIARHYRRLLSAAGLSACFRFQLHPTSISGTTSVATGFQARSMCRVMEQTGARLPSIKPTQQCASCESDGRHCLFFLLPDADEIVHAESYCRYNATFRWPALMRDYYINHRPPDCYQHLSSRLVWRISVTGVDDLVRPLPRRTRVFSASPATTQREHTSPKHGKRADTEFAIPDLDRQREVPAAGMSSANRATSHRFDVASPSRGVYLLSARAEGA